MEEKGKAICKAIDESGVGCNLCPFKDNCWKDHNGAVAFVKENVKEEEDD